MSSASHGYRCDSCGGLHDELPMALAIQWPYVVHELEEADRAERVEHDTDWCILDGERFFLRGCLELRVHDSAQGPFVWGVWVELAIEDFEQTIEAWEVEGRERNAPLLGRLANSIPCYDGDGTLDLPVHLHTRPVGLRPIVDLPPDDHAIALEQHEGITLDRVHAIVESCVGFGADEDDEDDEDAGRGEAVDEPSGFGE